MHQRSWLRGAITLGVLAALAGAMIASPVGAGFNPTKKKIRKVARNQARKVFNRAIGGAIGGKQDRCADGAILASAHVEASSTFPSTYTTDPGLVRSAHNCRSPADEVKVRRFQQGEYLVDLPGLTDDPANRYVVVTGSQGWCNISTDCTDASVNWISAQVGTVPVIYFTVQDLQPDLDSANDGARIDSPFSFAVLASS